MKRTGCSIIHERFEREEVGGGGKGRGGGGRLTKDEMGKREMDKVLTVREAVCVI